MIRGLESAGQVKEMTRRTDEWLFFYRDSFVNVSEADIRSSLRGNQDEFEYVEALSTKLNEMSRTIRAMQTLLKRGLLDKRIAGTRKVP